ncbi:MAG: methyltransferase domain-containing protein [Bacteroidota bacterium]
MRLMQHKKEAFWFYRFLSIFYDHYVNPLFWTESMRDDSLALAKLHESDIKVIDVGSGTGFTTQGIVKQVPASNVTCVDQSPHQMAKAKAKADLQNCTFQLGDAENIPFETDQFDRYVSAGSIEYWPDPARGIQEAYRVIKPGGTALMIGPLEPGNLISRFIARVWMLFPKESEYQQWYKDAGFTDIKQVYIQPHWYRGKKREYGIAISGVKPAAGLPPNYTAEVAETDEKLTPVRVLMMLWRVIVGSVFGFLFIPIALVGYLWSFVSGGPKKALTLQQSLVLMGLGVAVVGIILLVT